MAMFKHLFALCACSLLLICEVQSACDTTAAASCDSALSSNLLSAGFSISARCSAYATHISCAEAAMVGSDCPTHKLVYDTSVAARTTLGCGAAQLLMSWPMYIVVLVLSLKQLYSSAQ